MKRLIIIKNEENNTELTLPVTPESFQVSHGIDFETVNIHTLGDVAIAGYPVLATVKIDCMFPARSYPFNNYGTNPDPYHYVDAFRLSCDNHTALRLVVSGTAVNMPVKVESIEYGEKDGTNDVYASLTLREQKTLKAVSVQTAPKNANRSRAASSGKAATEVQSYTIRRGDTLSAICKKYYGNASLYGKLAAFNGIKNANLIYSGAVLKIPPAGRL